MIAVLKKIDISLTDFVDFVCKAGSAKLTQVKQIKKRPPYSPKTDYYKALREGIIENHENNGTKKDLNKIITAIVDQKKVDNYTNSVDGYKKFWGAKDIKWFKPPYRNWIKGQLNVRINPELGLSYNSKKYIVKLYLKADKLSKDKIEQILTLMESELRPHIKADYFVGILDVRNSKLFVKDNNDLSLLPLLDGEAISFETMWKAVV